MGGQYLRVQELPPKEDAEIWCCVKLCRRVPHLSDWQADETNDFTTAFPTAAIGYRANVANDHCRRSDGVCDTVA